MAEAKRRGVRTSYVVAGCLAVAAIAWIMSGQIGGSSTPEKQAATETQVAKGPVKVRVRLQNAEPHVRELVLRGQTEASRSVELRAETAGKVKAIATEEGARVTAGQVLVQLSLDDRESLLAQARAQVRQRQVEYDAALKLSQKGFKAETQLAESKALLEAARALLTTVETDIAHTTITAPFDGILETRYVEEGDFLDVGNEVARIVDLDPLMIVAQVSERNIGRLSLGASAEANLLTGQSVQGSIVFISSSADAATRTFRVEVEVANPDLELSEGVTTEIRLAVDQVIAHRVSPALLTLNEEGAIGIKVVDDENRVAFYPVGILSDQVGGIWLEGLPDTVTVITVGQEFVREGQVVEPVFENATAGQ